MSFIDFLAAQADLDLQMARRAFPVAQAAFDGPVHDLAAEAADVGWHDTSTNPETGSIALVREDSELVELVGDIVKISRAMPTETRVVFAYVLGTASIVDDLSLARRPFMGLGILANETLSCKIETIA